MRKILIIGGTNFIGRNLVDSLLQDNQNELTLFNRGKTNSEIFQHIKRIKGDRYTGDIKLLTEIRWDYVIDSSCYFPKNLSEIIKLLRPGLKKYIFISTCSVYEMEEEKTLLTETSAIKVCNKREENDPSNETYGKRKAKCEEIIKESGVNYCILRPALVYGEHDPTDRFYYWLHQINTYQEILTPQNIAHSISLTYVQDMVRVIKALLNENEDKEIYNVVSHSKVSISDIIKIASKLLNRNPILIKGDHSIFANEKISEWFDMPLWINGNHFTFSNEKIRTERSMYIKDFEDSVKETIQYYQNRKWQNPTYGMERDKQERVINVLKRSHGEHIT